MKGEMFLKIPLKNKKIEDKLYENTKSRKQMNHIRM